MNGDETKKVFTVLDHKEYSLANKDALEKPADFEIAISNTGFGKFNLILLLIGILATLSSMMATTTMSYILPIAQCDLNLSLENKGMLNAITYIGMISSAFLWGYLADTIGRKKLLVVGFFLDGFFVVLCGFSQQYTMLVASKFMTGFIINGPYAAVMSYMNEFHAAKYRPFIPMINGIVHSIASIIVPILGWLIFTDSTNISIFDGFLNLRSWNVFLLVCSLPSLLAGFGFIFLPESPKFLMTTGRNEKALEIFKNVYVFNHGKSTGTYPITSLLDETKLEVNKTGDRRTNVTPNRSKIQALKEGGQQLLPLFYPPYLSKILMVFMIQFSFMMGLNTLRLWLPQLFAAINDYRAFHSNEDGSMCDMIKMLNGSSVTQDSTCFVNYDNDSIYINNIIVALTSLGGYLIISLVIRKISKKFVLIAASLCSGICGISLIFAKSEIAVVILFSVYICVSGICTNVIISVVVDVFPTTLRTMTVSLTMMCGRSGAIIGNLTFPFLLGSGCLPPFLTLGCLAIGNTLLCMTLPKTDMKALE